MSARRAVLGVVLGVVALAALAAGLVLFLFRPLKAEPVALDALKGLRTREAPYGLEVLPQAPKALLAFYPGARVEPLAYAPVLAPLVGNGYLVVLLRVPQGIALLADRAGPATLEVEDPWNSSRPTAALPRYSQSTRPSRKRTWARA